MDMSRLYWFFAGAALALYAFLLFIMVRRKIRARFPVFFAYIAASLATLVVGNIALRALHSGTYFYVFWVMQGLVLLLSFGVLREVFSELLKPFNALIDLGRMLFWWAAGFLLFAAFLTALATDGTHSDQINASISLIQRTLQLMQCGLLLLLVVFDRRLGLSWRSHGMCIALGLGTYAAASLALSTFGCCVGGPNFEAVARYVLCLGVIGSWSLGLALPAPARKNALDSPKRIILQRWNEALSSYGYGDSGAATSSVESFLPGIEKTVDRVMARKAVS